MPNMQMLWLMNGNSQLDQIGRNQYFTPPDIVQKFCGYSRAIMPNSHIHAGTDKGLRVVMTQTEEDWKATRQECHSKRGGKFYQLLSPAADYFIVRATEKLVKDFNKSREGQCKPNLLPPLMSCFKKAMTNWKLGKRCSSPGKCKSDSFIKEQCKHVKQEGEKRPSMELMGSVAGTPCVTHLKVSMSTCTTCCCHPNEGGIASTQISHNLIYGSRYQCGSFFGITDTLIRLITTTWRAGRVIGDYRRPCFTKLGSEIY